MARTTAKTSRLVAVRPETARLAGSPALTSIRYCSAAPSAPPPGAIFASALPASCEDTTAGHEGPRNARYWSAHRHASASVCRPAIAASHPGASSPRSSQEPKTSIRLGATR